MEFKEGTLLYAYEVQREGGEDVLYFNFIGAPFVPSLIEDPRVMEMVISSLMELPNVSRIVFVQQKNYNYGFTETSYLLEIAQLYVFLTKQENILSPQKLASALHNQATLSKRYNDMFNFISFLKNDPIFSYHELNKLIIEAKVTLNKLNIQSKNDQLIYIHLLEKILDLLKKTKIIRDAMPFFENYSKGDREIYYKFFSVDVIPNYTFTRLVAHLPNNANIINQYKISNDLIRDLAYSKNMTLNFSDLNKLAIILVRHTVGFGLIEVLLQDKNIQDIVLNSPIPQTPIFIRHQEYGECIVNILPSQEDVDSWAAKFRMISGRPLDEANPILDTQLNIGNMSSRIAIIQPPLSSDGLAYAIRRHREEPWTLPLFVQNKMLTGFAAGLLSFLIDGSRTLLVAGTRSSGKTSLLGSLMLEIIPSYRIIVLEDTAELPVEAMRKLNYDILRMKVRSSLLNTTTEVSADEGIRASLRLGDSSLIIGEVRSLEAKALSEAMRIGALANVVAGTIHGASPYAIFDRVVNDLGVPITSFKATDIIAVANPIKTPDGLHSWKRLVQLSEVRKHWT